MITKKHGLKALLVLTAMITCLCLFSPAAYSGVITGINPVIPPPDGFSVDFYASYEDALAELPPTTTITVDDRSTPTVTLTWQTEEPWFPYAYGNYHAIGTFDLPAGVEQADPPIALKVTTILRMETGRGLMTLDWEGFNQPGDYVEETMWYEDAERVYHYYVPTSYDGTKPVPLLVDLHGGWSNGLAQWSSTRSDRYAEKEGFIVVAPSWGASEDLSVNVPNPGLYVSKIIDKLEATFNIDARRVYMCGVSGGGVTTGNFVLDYPGRIAAIGLVSGPVSLTSRLGAGEILKPMTVIMFGGTRESIGMPPLDDWTDFTSWNSSLAKILFKQFGIDPITSPPQIAEWPATAELDLDELPYWTSEKDARLISEHWPTSVTRSIYTGVINGSEVILYDIEGGGHVWPGGTQFVVPTTVGAQTYLIDATEKLWEHFSQCQLPTMETAIDIKLCSCFNLNDLKRRNFIEVSILTTEDLDATQVYPPTVRFGPAKAMPIMKYRWNRHWEMDYTLYDVDKDGDTDMILTFRMQETGIQIGDTSAELTGWSYANGAFFGSDSIEAWPPQKE